MNSATSSYGGDLEALRQRARDGRACHGTALLRAGDFWARLYQRRKARPGWPTTVRDVLNMSADLSPLMFFGRVPVPVWPVVLADDWSEWALLSGPLDAAENERILRKVLGQYLWFVDGDVAALAPSRMADHVVGCRLFSCINELHRTKKLDINYQRLAGDVAGRPYSEIVTSRSGAKIRPPIEHRQQLAEDGRGATTHPFLQSVSEVVVDGVLAHHLGSLWITAHRHAVPLPALVPDSSSSFSVDIVIYQDRVVLGVIEVGSGGELRNATYRRRRHQKQRVLSTAGIPVHACDLEGGRRTTHALRECIRWVLALLEQSRDLDETFLGRVMTHPDITTVSYATVEQHRTWIRDLRIRTVDEYEQQRLAAVSRGDDAAMRIVPRGTLGEWLKNHHQDWYELTGRIPAGQGSKSARSKSNDHHFYLSYAEARSAARRLGASSRTEFLKKRANDPRLPIDPDQRWPDEFRCDGWPGFLGTGAPNIELTGLISADEARKALQLGHERWTTVTTSLEPAAVRRGGKVRYFRPSSLIAHLARHGVVGSQDCEVLTQRLNALSRRGVP